MEIFDTHSDGATIVHLSGRINSVHAARLSEHLLGILDRADGPVVIDFARTDHMTSAALRSLVAAKKRAAASGTPMLLSTLPALIHEIFDISGLLELFTVAATPADALRRLAAEAGSEA